jgi:hypothetical protein
VNKKILIEGNQKHNTATLQWAIILNKIQEKYRIVTRIQPKQHINNTWWGQN